MRRGDDFMYGKRTIRAYTLRPAFELYDLEKDPDEIHNLANEPAHKQTLAMLTEKLKQFQKRTDDPWRLKWEHE
jgi:N-sulfoglucosamine sulfohydrolase